MDSTDFNPTPRADDSPDLGEIKINHNVVASIVRLATLQVSGVVGVGGGIVDGIGELFSKREADHRGVRVIENDEGDRYTIEVRIVIAYGSEIGRTAYDVQVAVKKQITAMTGKEVSAVNVIIEGVRLPSDITASKDKANEDVWADMASD